MAGLTMPDCEAISIRVGRGKDSTVSVEIMAEG